MDFRLLNDEIVITHANRTPIGAFLGNLKQYTAVDLGTHLINGMNIDKKLVDTVIIGSVLQAGLGQAQHVRLQLELNYQSIQIVLW